MGWFLNKDELVKELFDTIRESRKLLFIASPYIRLSNDMKHELALLRKHEKLVIKVMFGKNPENKSSSLNKDDLDFFKTFKSVEIRYNENLHAKYYANKKQGIVTSLNFLASSLKNNVEVGALYEYTRWKDIKEELFGDSFLSEISYEDNKAKHYFNEQFDKSSRVYCKRLGELMYDYSEDIFKREEKRYIKSYSGSSKGSSSDQNYSNAGEPWTQELDNELEKLFRKGIKTNDLMAHFGRSKGAIIARIEKLELEN